MFSASDFASRRSAKHAVKFALNTYELVWSGIVNFAV
jgi:hypothetical protein